MYVQPYVINYVALSTPVVPLVLRQNGIGDRLEGYKARAIKLFALPKTTVGEVGDSANDMNSDLTTGMQNFILSSCKNGSYSGLPLGPSKSE